MKPKTTSSFCYTCKYAEHGLKTLNVRIAKGVCVTHDKAKNWTVSPENGYKRNVTCEFMAKSVIYM